ncbi:hypothetical protein S40288_09014 [Stachybotrys chartarum IBT 40288]|nr:hypothetical protein S40288_09014 [Stachybotrys chartarum IBT 40288]
MVAVTIFGAGVTGMTIASQLPISYDITILGEHLPGDPLHKDYTSPWAGACWVGVPDSSPRDQKLQLESYATLWKLAGRFPDSGLRRTKMTEIFEYASPDTIWYSSKIHGFRWLNNIVISPPVFLAWMRSHLEAHGVKFRRIRVSSLEELKEYGHDILVNASGANTKHLADVNEENLVPYKLQSILMKKDYDDCFIYRGNGGYYFNIFGRRDGTTYILDRGNAILPPVLPYPEASAYNILYDIATTYEFRPQEKGGVRIEKEVLNGQKVVHAYGQEAGEYCYSFGLAKATVDLVAEFMFELPPKGRL